MILGVDPGKDKSGIAIVGDNLEVLHQEVVATINFTDRLMELQDEYSINLAVLGDGTKSQAIKRELQKLIKQIEVIDESYSTLEARDYYWRDNPPRGWRRLIPTSMQTPPRAIDDYVAIILILRYLKGN